MKTNTVCLECNKPLIEIPVGACLCEDCERDFGKVYDLFFIADSLEDVQITQKET